MLTADKLAVLVPVFNGGERVMTSISSCAAAGLPADRYEIIVVDNCSSDAAIDHVPSKDAQGATIQVHRNERNLGRVENWNRSVAIAREQGFRYITFLFVGDTWIANGSLPQLLDQVQQSGACIGLSSFLIAGENGETKRQSQRFYVSGRESTIVSAESFIAKLVASGLFPLGPLQANIYGLSPDTTLQFDADLPTRTDVEATLRFVRESDGHVAIASEPFFQWCEHGGRFHKSMGASQTVRDYIATFESARELTDVSVDYGLAKSRLILNSLRLALSEGAPSEWPRLLKYLADYAASGPERIGIIGLLRALWLRFVMRRHVLEFGADHGEQSSLSGEHCATH